MNDLSAQELGAVLRDDLYAFIQFAFQGLHPSTPFLGNWHIELIAAKLQAVAEQLCGGSLTPLLTHLVKAGRLSSDQRESLRSLLDDLDKEKKPGKKS